MNKKTCWILSLILILLGSLGSSSSSSVMALMSAQKQTIATHVSTSVVPDFKAFTGSWVAHGASLSFASTGLATFDGRVYRWCGPGVAQPCDYSDAQGIIHPGGHEQIQFSRVVGNTAYGTITASNLHISGLAVMVVLQSDNNTLLYTSQTPIALLCGPTAPAGTCGA